MRPEKRWTESRVATAGAIVLPPFRMVEPGEGIALINQSAARVAGYPPSGASSFQVCVRAGHLAASLAHLNCGRMSRCRNHPMIALSPF